MRRRALLAASAASGLDDKWAYELHLTPEWEVGFGGFYKQADIAGDFNELFELLIEMGNTIGYTEDSWNVIEVHEIPEECNVTVDGERLSYIVCNKDKTYIEVTFGSSYCAGVLNTDMLSLEKDIWV